MATFKELSPSDVKTSRSFLNQLVDIIQEDISGSSTRKKYQVFVTGGIGPGVTSSLFQTVYDQDFTLQTSNAIFDITVGLYSGSATVTGSSTGEDSSGKLLFPSQTLMMREKVNIYRQYAQLLQGDASIRFTTPYSNASSDGTGQSPDDVNEAMFINFKRLFARDSIKRETFAMKFFQSASRAGGAGTDMHFGPGDEPGPNLNQTTESGSVIYTDVGAASNIERSPTGGSVGNIVDASDTTRNVGLLFYDQGIAMFNLAKVLSGSQKCSGSISAVVDNDPYDLGTGIINIGDPTLPVGNNPNARFIPDLMVSASIDAIVDHLASCRFSSGSNTGITFQNITNINSTLIFCRATADEFNYSSNTTFVNPEDNRIRVIDEGQEDTQRTFSFVTSIGLYDANDNLLAVAKLSRPVEKNDEKDLTFRVRLDF